MHFGSTPFCITLQAEKLGDCEHSTAYAELSGKRTEPSITALH